MFGLLTLPSSLLINKQYQGSKDTVRFVTVRFGSVRFGSVRIGSVRAVRIRLRIRVRAVKGLGSGLGVMSAGFRVMGYERGLWVMGYGLALG